MRTRVIPVFLALVAGGANAAALDISLSNETANVVYLIDSGSLGYGGADIGFGFFYTEDSDYMLTANVMVVGTLGERRDLQFGVGAKAYGADLDIDEQVLAIGIGGQARYVFQTHTPIGLVLEGYAAPGITSFGETESARELNLRAEIEVLPSTRGYIGYRYLEFDLDETGDVTVDDNVHLGIRLQF